MGTNTYPLVPLENLSEIHDSKRIPVKKSDRKPGPYPYYGASGIVDYVDSYIFDGEFLLLAEDGENLRSQNLPIAFLAKGKFWVNNHAHVLQGKKGNNTRFLCYALQVADIRSYLSGSTRPKLTQADMKRILVPAPEPREQRAIAHILGTLDDKIELNRQMNCTLEAMAQALFKSWFIDFDPVVLNALRAGNPISEKFAQRAAHYRRLLNSPSPSGRGVGVREQKIQKLPPDILEFARNLRKNQTDAEQLLWQLLRGRRFLGLKFRRQHPVKPYVLDFFCHEMKLAVEVDGGQHNEAEHRCKDAQRTAYLADQGITVVRYWADTVLKDTSAVLQDLYEKVQQLKSASRTPSPLTPLPEGEGNWPFSEDILRLFPDRFQDSELGPIPEGWQTKTLREIIEVNPTRQIQKGALAPYLDMKSMPTEGMRPSSWRRRKYTSGMRFKNGDTLFARITPCLENGKTCHVNFLENEEIGWGSTEYVVLRSKPPMPNEYTYFLARERHFRDHAIANMTGSSGRQRVPAKAIENYVVAFATIEIYLEFSNNMNPIVEKTRDLDNESKILTKLRDTLLPKLVSGELRVPDAEKLLEDGL